MANDRCALCDSGKIGLYCTCDKMLFCHQCGVVFLAPGQVPAKLDDYYQNNPFYAQNATNPDSVRQMIWTARFYLKAIIRHLKNPAGKLLVDVGSNYGILVEEALKIGFKAIGLEKNSWLVAAGQKRGLNILTSDLSKLAVADPLKVITAMHVLEHLTDPRSFIKDAYQKLTPTGILAIGVPNIKSYLAKKDGLSWRYVALEHLFYFSTEVLAQLLKQEGFEIIEVKQDGSNLTGLSIKKLLHYLVGDPIMRDRFQMKNWGNRASKPEGQPNWVKKVLKKILIFVIKILRREDFILIIARKTARLKP